MIRKLRPVAVVTVGVSLLTTFLVGGSAGTAAAAALGSGTVRAATAKPTPPRPAPASTGTKRGGAKAAPEAAAASGASGGSGGSGASGAAASGASGGSSGFPVSPPARVCGDASLLSGPAAQPPGSVRVDPGQDLYGATLANPAGSTFWLSPGVHTLAPTVFGQVIPKDGDTYLGAPGAVMDGQG
ncbi:MAG: hypothetical protein QOJ52_1297, partial [Acidimicrobiaceae bacterium]|nr:hypothetical protein [Acidimicrobiaceae bacterium]